MIKRFRDWGNSVKGAGVLARIGEHTRPRVSSSAPSPKTFGCGREQRTQKVSGGGAENSTRGRVRSPPLARHLRKPSPVTTLDFNGSPGFTITPSNGMMAQDHFNVHAETEFPGMVSSGILQPLAGCSVRGSGVLSNGISFNSLAMTELVDFPSTRAW